MAYHCKGCVLGKKEMPSTAWTGEQGLQQTTRRQETVEHLFSRLKSLQGSEAKTLLNVATEMARSVTEAANASRGTREFH
jgi:hypothetical protein